MVKTFSTILTENWQPTSWQNVQYLASQPKYEQAKFYYDNGYLKIEMSPLGSNHGRDNAIVARVISLFATFNNIPVVEFSNTPFRKLETQECPPRSNEPIDLNQYEPPTLVIEIASTTLSDDLGPKRLRRKPC